MRVILGAEFRGLSKSVWGFRSVFLLSERPPLTRLAWEVKVFL